ncbi:terminase gpA endonuclease subunit [Paraburkholderia kururiensis]|uniref:terminase gpA endonuclease subunit n=1 Tax=Paraburkholderia kururiensis TaxID=984307 RepID=UPI0009DCDAE1|nr:terminase gpA endonuclease subunit [Paraburkholderia kururiensis]
MPIRAFGFDSGGEAGVTQQAYAAWRRWRKLDGVVRLFGKIAGRDAWNVLPSKGASALTAQRLVVTYPDTARKSNRAAAGGTVPVAQFNPNSFKDDLAGQLQKADLGSWYVHFPHALRSPEEPHVWLEQLTSEIRAKNGRWEKAVKSRRNEVLDLMVLTHVVAHLHDSRRSTGQSRRRSPHLGTRTRRSLLAARRKWRPRRRRMCRRHLMAHRRRTRNPPFTDSANHGHKHCHAHCHGRGAYAASCQSARFRRVAIPHWGDRAKS